MCSQKGKKQQPHRTNRCFIFFISFRICILSVLFLCWVIVLTRFGCCVLKSTAINIFWRIKTINRRTNATLTNRFCVINKRSVLLPILNKFNSIISFIFWKFRSSLKNRATCDFYANVIPIVILSILLTWNSFKRNKHTNPF